MRSEKVVPCATSLRADADGRSGRRGVDLEERQHPARPRIDVRHVQLPTFIPEWTTPALFGSITRGGTSCADDGIDDRG
jgi:hypothetical protein